MTDDTWMDPEKGPGDQEVAIDYIKSGDFRCFWADGAIGSVTPNGMVHFALYSERYAIPRRQVYTVQKLDVDKGRLGPEILEKRIARESVVREMACDVVISPAAAEQLANWLLAKVQEANGQVEPKK